MTLLQALSQKRNGVGVDSMPKFTEAEMASALLRIEELEAENEKLKTQIETLKKGNKNA